MIIKAGTYRWNDELTAYDVTTGSGTGLGISFILPDFSFSVSGQTLTLGFSGTDIEVFKDPTSEFYLAYDGLFVDEDGGSISGSGFVVYTDTVGWNAFETLNDSVSNFEIIKNYLPDDYAKTFIVAIDTEVDDDKGTWFTSNTTMLIKAGTYRWNDTITLPSFNFNVQLSYIVRANFSINETDFSLEEGYTEFTYTAIKCNFVNQSYYELSYATTDSFTPVYSLGNDSKWNNYSDTLNRIGVNNASFANGFGQIITITADQYVPTNFGLWANENWKEYSEEEETYTIGAGIYKFKSTLTRPSTDFSQEMSFAVVGSEQINENARYRLMETGRDMYLDFINAGSDAGIAFYAFEETSNGNIGFLWDTQTIQVLEPIKASAVFNDWFKASTEKIVNPDTLKAKIQSLIAKANTTTGKSDTDLTSGVNSLIEGYSAEPNLQYKELVFEKNNVGTSIKPDEGYDGLSEVFVSVSIPELGGDAEFNIAYGDTEPTDTSKLWIKTSEPEAVRVVAKIEAASEELETQIGALPTAATAIASATVGAKVYLFGGMASGFTYLDTINVFDTESETITTLSTTLPTGACYISSVTVGTKIYLFGGRNSNRDYLNTINVFDTESNTITTLSTTLPTGTQNIASAVVGTKIYLFGGDFSGGWLDTINVFDTESETITTLSTTLPTGACYISSVTVGTKIYLFGGRNSNSDYLNTINVFDTESNTITTLSTTLPTAAAAIASAVVGTKIYLFGGVINASGGRIDTINVFDTESNTITTLSTTLPTVTQSIASAVVGTKIYLFGGMGDSWLNTINVFVVASALAANNILIEASTVKNIFNLLPMVELGVNAVYLGNADGAAETVAAALYVGGAWAEI